MSAAGRTDASTLRARLTRAALQTTLGALLLSAALILVLEVFSYRDERMQELQTQADIVAKAIASSLLFDDPDSATAYLRALQARGDVQLAAVYRADGFPFAAWAAPGGSPPPSAIAELRDGLALRQGGTVLELTRPVVHDDERIGTVYLRARHDVVARIAGYAGVQALVVAASLAVGLFAFGRLQRSITNPIVQVTQVAREVIERRDWKLRAPSTDTREIDVLVDAFNGMLAEVDRRTEELEREMAERRKAEEDLRAADRRKDEFLATLAHELRNPLAPMRNAVLLLDRPGVEPRVREKAVGILDRQLTHVVRLIDDLLDVSRITMGKLTLHRERVDAVAVLRTALELAEPAVHERGLTLSTDLPDQGCHVEGDAARLLQVFANLLNNACRYTPGGGHVEASARCRDGWVEVAVRDDGIGIEPALQQRIFELFEQADKSLERGNSGLGIGLTLARRLAQLHGGEITVDSAGAGRGSCFTVRLPMSDRPEARPPEPPPVDEGPVEPLHILVADDNVDFAGSLRLLLELRGHRVEVVHDGQQAIAAARAGLPDVAILDIGMPGMNGYRVATALRADEATRPIRLIAASGWGQSADQAQALAAGFGHHLVKPVRPEQLDALLRDMPPRPRRERGREQGEPVDSRSFQP